MKLSKAEIEKILVWAHAALSGVQLKNTPEDDDLRTRLMEEIINFQVSDGSEYNPEEIEK